MSSALAYPAQFLREVSRTRYFATLFLPAEHRDAITALYAFSADVAAIRDRAREPAAGEIRLQWWVDALAGEGHGAVRQNPLAAALLDAISTHSLPAGPLRRLLAARRFDLYQDPMPDLDTFEGYAGETVSVLYQLAAMILNGSEVANGDAAGHLGVADALIGHLRALGHNAARGRIFLPMALFAANGVTEAELLSGTESEGLFAARDQIADLAADHLNKAERAIRALPRALRPAFVTLPVLRAELARVQGAPTPFSAPAPLSDFGQLARMGAWGLFGR
jgi:phytoene synthase